MTYRTIVATSSEQNREIVRRERLARRMFQRGRWAFLSGKHCVPGLDPYWDVVGKLTYHTARDWRHGWLHAAAEA